MRGESGLCFKPNSPSFIIIIIIIIFKAMVLFILDKLKECIKENSLKVKYIEPRHKP